MDSPVPAISTVAETPLGPIVESACRGLKAEIEAAQRDPGRMITITEGERISNGEDSFLYHFRSDASIPFPPDTSISVTLDNGESVRGVLVGLQDFDLFISVERNLDDFVKKAKMSSEPWFIWQALIERLKEINSEKRETLAIPLALLNLGSVAQGYDEEAARTAEERLAGLGKEYLVPNASQRFSMSRCAGSNLHFVWGPPGTGKTANLAQVAATIAVRGECILLLSHANVAVDVAILRIAEAFEKTQDLIAGRILRIGVPQMLEVRNRGDITPEDVLVRTQPDLIRARDELEKRRDQVTREFGTAIDVETKNRLSKELEGVRGRLRKVREDIRLATAKIMGEARIVAATFSRFAIDDRLYQWPAEAILIDEASMAPFPAVLAAAFCARKRLAIFGDFRQLPPIVISTKTEAKTWVGRDAFEIAGIIDAVDEGRDDPRVTLLETQYRMSGEIASLVSDLAYGGRLRTASGVNERNASLAAHSPHSGNPVVFLDSADMDPICLKEQRFGSHSRGNPIHAAIDVVLAEGLILQGCPTVTIVTPYRSQARLISIVIRENKMEKRIRSATVHRFQGSESDAVIVDLVDGPPMSGASHLTGKNRDDSLRLINVALSRAKGKLFIIANVDHIRDTYKASTWMRKLAGRFVSSNEAWRPLSREFALFAKGKNLGWFSRWEEGEAAACAALEACRENLILNLPCELPYSPEFRARLLSVAQRLRKAIIFTTQEIAEELSDTAAELRLLAHPGGFFLLVDNEAAIFGGTSGEGAFIQVKKKRVVEALEEFFLGEMGRRPPPKADIKHALDALCGRCDECGEFRRPRKLAPDDWRLSCPKGHQGPTPLELGEMQRMIDVLNMQCRKCGNAPVLRKGPKGIFLGCSNFSHGCKGALLSLDTLFEEN